MSGVLFTWSLLSWILDLGPISALAVLIVLVLYWVSESRIESLKYFKPMQLAYWFDFFQLTWFIWPSQNFHKIGKSAFLRKSEYVLFWNRIFNTKSKNSNFCLINLARSHSTQLKAQLNLRNQTPFQTSVTIRCSMVRWATFKKWNEVTLRSWVSTVNTKKCNSNICHQTSIRTAQIIPWHLDLYDDWEFCMATIEKNCLHSTRTHRGGENPNRRWKIPRGKVSQFPKNCRVSPGRQISTTVASSSLTKRYKRDRCQGCFSPLSTRWGNIQIHFLE